MRTGISITLAEADRRGNVGGRHYASNIAQQDHSAEAADEMVDTGIKPVD